MRSVASLSSSQPQLYSESLGTPSGWYCVGAVGNFAKETVSTRRLGGRDIVVLCTEAGHLAALDAYCPHLGAHLGKGGRIDGETIRCPFHGFCFDASGVCTKTPYGIQPRKVRARSYPVLVVHGVALAYFHPRGLEPTWQPEDVDMEGWAPFRFHTWTLRGHPQETSENSVDLGHFGIVHGYKSVRELAPVSISGAHLFARYGFERPLFRLGGREISAREAIDVHVWGLGYSRVEVSDLLAGLDLRLLVLSTPLDADHIELRIGLSVRDSRASPRLAARLRWLPRFVTDDLLGRALLGVYRREIEQDFAIWKHKRYVDPPQLAPGDGPVGIYRKWVRQFYECRLASASPEPSIGD
jgi:nitrite reductase/ring-hydroxylating ferredoxin subunit